MSRTVTATGGDERSRETATVVTPERSRETAATATLCEATTASSAREQTREETTR